MVETQQEIQYRKSIHEALYPRWYWCGGYVIADVFDNGKKVVLTGYANPSEQEINILINRIEKCLKTKPEIYWKLIGSQNESLIQLTENISKINLQQQINRQLTTLFNNIYAKAEQDIKTVGKFPQYTVDGLNASKDLVIKYSQDGFNWVGNNYNQIIDGTIKVIEPLRQELIKHPNEWFRRFNEDTIAKVNQAQDDFYLIKENQVDKTPDQLATFIIVESFKKSTVATIIDSGIGNFINSDVVDLTEDFLNKNKIFDSFLSDNTNNMIDKIRETIFEQPSTSDSMLTMITQIACAYESDDLTSPEKQRELMFIFMICFLCSVAIDSDFADLRQEILNRIDINKLLQKIGIKYNEDIVNKLQKGIDKAKDFNSLQNFILSIVSNIALFLIVGVITKLIYKYYKNPPEILKSMKLFNKLKGEASQSVFELAENTEMIEDVIIECSEIEKIEIETALA